MTGNYSAALRQVTVGGRILSDLVDAEIPEITDSEVTRIMAGGKKAIGFNKFPNANSFDYTFSLATPSGDDRFLFALSQSQETVAFSGISATDITELPDGAFTGIAATGALRRQRRATNDEAEAQSYIFKANGFTMSFKNEDPIVVG